MSDYLKRKKIELLQSLSEKGVTKLLKNNSDLDTDILQAIQYFHLAGEKDSKSKPVLPKDPPKPVIKDEPKDEPKPVIKDEPKNEPKPVIKDEPKNEPKPVIKDEPKNEPKPVIKDEPKDEPKPKSEDESKSKPKPKPKPKPKSKPKDEPKLIPKDDLKQSTNNLLFEIGDTNNGIFIANSNDNLLIHMGDGNIEPHSIFIDDKGDDSTKTHGNNDALQIEIGKNIFQNNNKDSTIIIELYPQTTDDEDIGGVRVWSSGVLVASYQHDFTQNYIHNLNAVGGFKQINKSIVSNAKFENWNKDTPNNCLIFYKKTGKFIDSNLIKTILPKKKKTYKNFKGHGKDIITHLSKNTDDDYKVTLSNNSPLFTSTKTHFESHTILLCFY
tara:strand:+ start:11543 stop:12694 length:1152 start_codon:yes stop_codon:yes gene_type:complete